MAPHSSPARQSTRAPLRRVWGMLALLGAMGGARTAFAAPEQAAALAPRTLAMPTGPGSVRGLADEASLDVFTGQAHEDIPIDLPHAAAGFVPPLGLHYHGELGNGPLGIGWTLGVPSLSRSLRRGVPSFTSADEIELTGVGGGGRLVAIAPGEYRLEGAGQQVRIRGDVGSGFVVDDGSGGRYHFGQRARLGEPGRVSAWLLESVEDVAGQRATYEYTVVDGVGYLDRISWGDGQRFAATLDYEDRPDVVTSLRSGTLARLSRRLATVRVSVADQPRHTHRLAYDDHFALSRLSRITLVGRDGQTAVPATTLRYAQAGEPRTFELAGARGWAVGARGCSLVDLDGDGIADFYERESGTFLRNLGDGFDRSLQTHDLRVGNARAVRFVDLDGDGQVEFVDQAFGDGWEVSRLDVASARWVASGRWPGTAGAHLVGPSVTLVDINGDGLPDLVQERDNDLTVALGGRSGLGPPRAVPGLPSARARLSSGRARWVDANGDGLVDVLALDDSTVQFYLGRGDGTFLDAGAFPYPWDGATQSFTNLTFADLDRDGIADLVSTSHGHVTWYLGRAAGGWERSEHHLPPPGTSHGTPTLADIDGNGSLDVVWTSGWAADLTGTAHPGMLHEIDNGMGAVTRLTYTSSTSQMVAAARHGRTWVRHMATPIPVVARLDRRVAGGATQTSLLTVRDAAWDRDERRFAGFLASERTELGETPASTLVETTFFHEGVDGSRVLRGRIEAQTRHAERRLERQAWHWSAFTPTTLAGHHEPLLRVPVLVREQRWVEGAAGPDGPLPEIRVDYTHDDEGRVAQAHHHGVVDVPGDESITGYTYASAEHRWIRGVLTATALYTEDGELVSVERHHYDGNAEPLPHGQVTRGWLRLTDAWLDTESRWVPRARIDYDRYGNPTRIWEHGQRRRVAYDAAGVHPISETLETGAGQALVWEQRWDEVLGQPIEQAAPDGSMECVTYDPLGRPCARARGSDPAYETYVYDWHGPTPRTTTAWHDGAAGARQQVAVADGQGRPLYRYVPLGRGTALVSGWQRYGARGEVVAAATPYESDLAAVATPPPGTGMHHYTYDALGRPLQTHLASGAVRSVTHTGLTETVDETALAQVVYERDGAGRIRRTCRHMPGSDERTDATYDAAGQLTALTLQGDSVAYSVTYDSLGRRIHSQDSDTGARHQVWDDNDHLIAVRHDVGTALTYTYDTAGRLLRRNDGRHATTYHYDTPRTAGFAHTVGRLAWAEDAAGAIDVGYDAAGRVDHLRRRIGSRHAERRLQHSPTGLVLAIDTDGVALQYGYDAAGRLAWIGDTWRAEARSATGGILAETFGNGVRQRVTRNALDQITATTLTGPRGALADLRAHYTPFGALAAIDDVDDVGLNHSARFTYDPGARLVRADVAGNRFDYAYDALQNMTARAAEGPTRLDMGMGTYRYNGAAGPRRLQGAGARAVAHDRAGRVTRAGDAQLEYDGFDRLVRVALPDGRDVTHVYGFDGERACSNDPSGTERFFFADLSEGPSGREQRITEGARTVARLVTPIDPGPHAAPPRLIYHHATFADGATLLTDATGALLDERLYEPFGADIAVDYAADARGRADKPRDALTGYIDHGARWAAPALAAWLTPDPPTLNVTGDAMLAPWELHPYQYLRHSPTLFRDADGRFAQLAVQAAVGGAIGGVVGGATYAAASLIADTPTSAGGFAGAVGQGTISGAVAGLTLGSSVLLSLGGSVAGDAVGGAAGRYLAGQDQSLHAVASDVAVGAASFGLGRAGAWTVAYRYARAALPADIVKNLGSRRAMVRLAGILESAAVSPARRGSNIHHFDTNKNFAAAQKDFTRFAGWSKVRKRVTPDGPVWSAGQRDRIMTNVREHSRTGPPTLEITGKDLRIKVRYRAP